MNFKSWDDSALGRFWKDALGWGVSSETPGVTNVEPSGLVLPDPTAVCVDVVTVPDLETVKYRAHLDLATSSLAHQTELVARLKELGAISADIGQGDVPWREAFNDSKQRRTAGKEVGQKALIGPGRRH
ncbi:VOC family protein [Cryobacterium ruanii]|uniref:VOC family protein n=1 Tax=Cryobacterium ruanii TaxID=1259197 RepID=UPI001F547536|nr:VOC family protein [Cryobacterium ruanii]